MIIYEEDKFNGIKVNLKQRIEETNYFSEKMHLFAVGEIENRTKVDLHNLPSKL